MKRAAFAVLLVACTSSTNDFPTRPSGAGGGTVGGGGGGGGGTIIDGGDGDAGDAGDAGVAITGRACLLADMRKLTACASTGMAVLKLKVALTVSGTVDAGAALATAVPDDTGRFTITAPLGAGFTWQVSGSSVVTSVMPFGTDNTIPVMRQEDYIALLTTNVVPQQDEGHGAVVVRVVTGTSAVTGVSAVVSPVTDSATLYDSTNSATDWNTARTQSDGVVWIPAVPLPQGATASITLSQQDGTRTSTIAPVQSQSITFVTQSVP